MATFLAGALHLQPAGTDPFGDVARSPHHDSIVAVSEAGIAGGYPDGTFRPNTAVTRGQAATFIARALSLPTLSARRSDLPRGL